MIREIEELSLNAWPALQTMLKDGWLLRFADGYTKRANSVNSIYNSCGDVEEKIDECESLYREKGIDVAHKITSLTSHEHLDAVLDGKGYRAVDETSVQLVELRDLPAPSWNGFHIDENFSDRWFAHFCRLKHLKESDRTVMKQLLTAIVPKTCFLTLHHEGQVVACGLGVLEKEYLGIFHLVTDVAYRNQGFGKQMVLKLLHWGVRHGARYSYLQVMLNNGPAMKLYQKLGFHEIYKYWYRVKSQPNGV